MFSNSLKLLLLLKAGISKRLVLFSISTHATYPPHPILLITYHRIIVPVDCDIHRGERASEGVGSVPRGLQLKLMYTQGDGVFTSYKTCNDRGSTFVKMAR
jgi:hypothetical protein